MKCGQRELDKPPCKKKGIIDVPTGYGRTEKMCLEHCWMFARAKRREFQRLAVFYDEIGWTD